jgi:leucyl/phenylalanyl-tRNA--protein transferase
MRLLDVQWCTAHLASLGSIEVPRPQYLSLLAEAIAAPK